jgi:Icc-related predicted phosphoesterase
VISDVVNRLLYSPYLKELAGKAEIIVSCGDLPVYYLDYLVSNLGKPLLYVCGNHDSYGKTRHSAYHSGKNSVFSEMGLGDKEPSFGGRNLDGRTDVVKNLIFGGLEGSILYNYGDHQYTETQMRLKILGMAPSLMRNKILKGRFIDVLVTHAPPRGIHDKDDRAHMGFEAFLSFIKVFRPAYLIHGHTHLYDMNEKRKLEYLGTKVINCYDYQILDIEAG